jgi:hypothetical protein
MAEPWEKRVIYRIFGVVIANGRKQRRYFGHEETEKDAMDAVASLTCIGSDCEYAYMKPPGEHGAIYFKRRSPDYEIKIKA